MNATSLFVSTSRVVLQCGQAEEDSDSADLSTSSWADLHRLVPYLRQSLSCTVCANLLVEPFTPSISDSDSLTGELTDTASSCQHHVCRGCRGGRKKLKPSCSWCKDYDAYVENVLLRILLQCYKKLCAYVTSTAMYRSLLAGGSSLVELINEGAEFKDDFKSSAGLSRSAYSILPCVYSNALPQPPAPPPRIITPSPSDETVHENEHVIKNPVSTVSNGSSLYSVFNIGSKMTFKRKTICPENDVVHSDHAINDSIIKEKIVQPRKSLSLKFKKPLTGLKSIKGVSHSSLKPNAAIPKQPGRVATMGGANSLNMKRRGCRCGNATATPGKLTCCGQRCPCYVDGKACVDCRCKGCRNPHRPGGHKVRPHIPELETYQIHLNSGDDIQTIDQHTPVLSLASPSELAASNAGATVQVLGVYTTQLHPVTTISSSLPAAILVGDESSAIMEDSSEIETSDVEVDC